MRRALALLIVLAALAGPAATAGVRTASVVNVTEKEWKLTATPSTVPAGQVTFVVRVTGRYAHELVVLKTSLSPAQLMPKSK